MRRGELYRALCPRLTPSMKLELRSRVSSRVARRTDLRFSGLLALGVAFGVAGCGSDDKTDENTPTDVVELVDANNYTSSSSLTIPTVETAPATDLDICWDGLDKDLQCHGVDAQGDIDNIGLLRFQNLSEDQVEAKLTAGQLAQSEVAGYLDYQTKNASTCTKLSSLTLFGTVVKIADEYIEDDERTYMLLFSKGTTPGVGARTMTFIKPTATSTNTTITAPSGCGLLEFSANLTNATPLKLPADGPWNLDWKKVKRDSLGNPIAFEAIDSVLLGYFDGMDVAELQGKLMDMELLATDIWEIPLKGARTADLAKAVHRKTKATFKGFDRQEDGVWALGLMCSTCQNPAPLLLTVVDAGAE